MIENIVIVESPNKKEKIQNILINNINEENWLVYASFGHIKNLPKSRYSLSFSEDGFTADFVESEIWKKIKKEIIEKINHFKKNNISFFVWIATDPDIEGDVIAFDIHNSLMLDFNTSRRVIFSSLSETSVVNSFLNPVQFNMNSCYAGIARRVIDRDVGYLLSSFLRQDVVRRYDDYTIAQGIGRVSAQSLNILADKHFSILNYTPQKYLNIILTFSKNGKIFNAIFEERYGEESRADAERILEFVTDEKANFSVAACEEKTDKILPPSPLDNTSLLYAGWYLHRINEKETMALAQSLFEKGYITYHRSDSIEISDESIFHIRNYISEHMDPDALPEVPNKFKNKTFSQEGHEAILPVSFRYELSPSFLQRTSIISDTHGNIGGIPAINKNEFLIYSLIWNRAIASQLESAYLDSSIMTIKCGEYYFLAKSKKIISRGWLDFLGEYILKSTVGNSDYLTKFKKNEFEFYDVGSALVLKEAQIHESDTETPKRYGRGQYIKAISNKNIGRPSTLYSIPNELLEKKYANIDKDGIYDITEEGLIVMEWIYEVFPNLVKKNFIDNFQEELKEISEGNKNYEDFIIETHRDLMKIAQTNHYDLGILNNENALIKQNSTAEKISVCIFCDNGSIFESDKCFYCDSCSFSIEINDVSKYFVKLGKDIDTIFTRRVLHQAIVSRLPIVVPKIKSKKGFFYDGSFEFFQKENKKWWIRFTKRDAKNDTDSPSSEKDNEQQGNAQDHEKSAREQNIDDARSGYGSESDFYEHIDFFIRESYDDTFVFFINVEVLDTQILPIDQQSYKIYMFPEFIAIIAKNVNYIVAEDIFNCLSNIYNTVLASNIVNYMPVNKQCDFLFNKFMHDKNQKNFIDLEKEKL